MLYHFSRMGKVRGGGAAMRAARMVFAVSATVLIPLLFSALVRADETAFFRIGTGGQKGTYFPIGSLIASAISDEPGKPECAPPRHCGVRGLVAVAQTSNGSVANIKDVSSGVLESGLAQADVAFWAYSGVGPFQEMGPAKNVRAIAGLYPESFQLVARKGSDIRSVKDLIGKRVSLDELGSGTLVDARLVLAAYGVREEGMKAEYVKPSVAARKIEAGKLDAFFIIAGLPTASVAALADAGLVELVPITGAVADTLVKAYPFFSPEAISAGTYAGVSETRTLSVRALWVVGASVPETLVYDLTKTLWSEPARAVLDHGHAKGKEITLKSALEGVAIPLHPGALRFYREAGLVK